MPGAPARGPQREWEAARAVTEWEVGDVRRGLLPRGAVLIVLAMLAAVGAVLAWSTWLDIRSGTRHVEDVMLAQAQSISDLVTESAGHGFETYRRWEDEIAARLLDNARWVARLDSAKGVSSSELARLARIHGLGRINVFDAGGEKIASSQLDPEEGITARHDPRDYIAPILRGETRELRIGFKPARYRGGSRFAVAVARSGGGAVVVNVFADSIHAILDSVRPGHLLNAFGRVPGVRYVVLQQADSVLAASPGAPDTPVGAGDPAPGRLVPGAAPLLREMASPAGRVYEVARAVTLPEAGVGVLRVGLDPAPLDRARAELQVRGWSRAVVLLAVAGLAMVLLMIWQRHGVLAGEVRRVRAELEARERETRRSDRLTAMGGLAAHVAHEIRNPLNTIHMTAQQMARDPGLDAELRVRAEDMRAESRRIEGIVQQFLEVARPRRPQVERLDLTRAVTAAGRAAEPAFEAAGRWLVVRTAPAAARLDPAMLGEIIENLLRNAREAAPAGGHVTLGVRRNGAEALIEVEDDGPGVAPELRERVFDLYYTTKPRGTGLGLSLVAQMAAAMGGGVRVEDAPGGGARFVVHFSAEDGPA